MTIDATKGEVLRFNESFFFETRLGFTNVMNVA